MVALLSTILAKSAAEEGKDIVLSMLVVGLVIVGVVLIGDAYNWRARKRHRA